MDFSEIVSHVQNAVFSIDNSLIALTNGTKVIVTPLLVLCLYIKLDKKCSSAQYNPNILLSRHNKSHGVLS